VLLLRVWVFVKFTLGGVQTAAQTDMEIALEMVRRAASREAMLRMNITTFMGLTPGQIRRLMVFYEEKTGKNPSTIETT
jgi:hypothetical protein